MRYYPVNLDLKGRSAVVVGGGMVALRKIRGFLSAGARVVVIEPRPGAGLRRLVSDRKVSLKKRSYRKGDLKGAFVAVAATNDPRVQASVSDDAKQLGVMVNVVDQPRHCSFTFPSIISRGEFLLTVSTGGGAPGLARHVRMDLQKRFGREYGPLVSLLSGIRRRLQEADVPNRAAKLRRLIRSINP